MGRALLVIVAVCAAVVVAGAVFLRTSSVHSSTITVVQTNPPPSNSTSQSTQPTQPASKISVQRLCSNPALPALTKAPRIEHATRQKHAIASRWNIGEPGDGNDAGISNVNTAWQEPAIPPFGGSDTPFKRSGDCPAGFIPKENPFYVALPLVDDISKKPYFDKGAFKWVRYAARFLPELLVYKGGRFNGNESVWKNRWVEIGCNSKYVFAQIEDTGPSQYSGIRAADFQYVLGTHKKPKNQYQLKAGIDFGPAVWHTCGTGGEGNVTFRLVASNEVPYGPWSVIVDHDAPHWS